MKLLMLCYYFPPRGGSGVQRSFKFAKHFVAEGAEVTVITCDVEDVTATVDKSVESELTGVEIVRVPASEARFKQLSRWKLGPLVSLMFRPDAHILWVLRAYRSCAKLFRTRAYDAIYVTVQPWSTALLGVALKRLTGLPLLVDFRDPWSFSTSQNWPTIFHWYLDRWIERQVFRAADKISVVTPGMQERYVELYPQFAEKVSLVFNGYDPSDFGSSNGDRKPTPDSLTIAFTGRLYSVCPQPLESASLRAWFEYRNVQIDFSTHSVRYLANVIAKVRELDPVVGSQIKVRLAGNIPGDNQSYVQTKGLSNQFEFLGMLEHSAALDLVAQSDMTFLPMMQDAGSRRSFNASGKIFEYLAARVPVFALIPDGDAADLIREAQAGWVFAPDEVDTAARTLMQLLKMKLQEGVVTAPFDGEFIAAFERGKQAIEMLRMLEELADE